MKGRLLFFLSLLFLTSCSYKVDLFSLYVDKANEFEAKGKLNKTIEYYKKALAVSTITSSKRDKLILKLATTYEALSAYRDAIKYYSLLLGNKKYFCLTYKKLGGLYYTIKNFIDSSAFYELFLTCKKHKTKDILTEQINLGKSYFFSKDYFNSKRVFASIKVSNIDKIKKQKILFYKGQSLYELAKANASDNKSIKINKKNVLKAISFLKECIKEEPNNIQGVTCSFFVANMFVSIGRADTAISHLERIYNLYPSKSIIRHKISVIRKYY